MGIIMILSISYFYSLSSRRTQDGQWKCAAYAIGLSVLMNAAQMVVDWVRGWQVGLLL